MNNSKPLGAKKKSQRAACMSDLPMQEKVNGSCVDSKEKGEGKGHTLETVRNNVEHFIQRRAIKACVCVCETT